MRFLVAIVAASCCLVGRVSGALNTYFAEDVGPGNDSVRLPSHPNSDAARGAFLAMLGSMFTEGLEGFSAGQVAPVGLSFQPAVSATLTGRGEIMDLPSGTYGGTHPISGSKFWLVDNPSAPFTITFTAPVEAFGFYATDPGDIGAQLVLVVDGTTQLEVPHTREGPSGGVIFFGVVSTGGPFSSVTFLHTLDTSDGFGYDDFVVGWRPGSTSVTKSTWGRVKNFFGTTPLRSR